LLLWTPAGREVKEHKQNRWQKKVLGSKKKAEKAAQIAGFLLRVDVIKSRLCGAVVGCSRGLHDLGELSTRKVERGKFMELLNCSLLSRQPSPPPPPIQ
jgi:hypothetical protein